MVKQEGIVGYGVYVPRWRLKASEIAEVWGTDKERIKSLAGEKAVGGPDEDATTMAVEASRQALLRAQIDPTKICAIYVGSESHPYVVKSTSSIVAEAIGATPELSAADLEFACRAGTAAMQIVLAMIEAGRVDYGLAIGSDTAQGRPGDELEYTAASGACAYILGKSHILASIEDTYSFTTDTPDFWRREGEDYPRHGGRFTGGPAYFTHVLAAARGLLEKTGTKASDYDYFVFHQPNTKFPLQAAAALGVDKAKVMPGLMVPYIGNTYSASSLIGLAAVLDVAKPGQRILMTSFGSGAGSDSFSIEVKDLIENVREKARKVSWYIGQKDYVGYAMYARFRKKLKGVA